MCLSPLHIKSNLVYNVAGYTPRYFDVPCGKCLECKEQYMSEWQTRLSFHIDSLYKRGGLAVMLTFTYNNENLPCYHDNERNFHFVCFNHDHVLVFLNRLKAACWRRYGKHSYSYFFTSEYGKDTRRPHYHAIFFLEPQISNYVDFCELCRKLWTYGFMFPKYDKHTKCYLDSFGDAITPVLRSLTGGAKYVTKYVTKDLSYINNPAVMSYIRDKENKERMKRYLPKHWQSNRLGYTIIDHVNLFDSEEFKRLLDNGIYNPLLGKNVPLPSYFINKLLYKNVPSWKTESPRLKCNIYDPLREEYYYDREFTDFGRVYMRHVFDSRVKRRENKISEVLQLIRTDNKEMYSLISPYIVKLENYGYDLLHTLALYHELFKNFRDDFLEDALKLTCGSVHDLFDDDLCFRLWFNSRDTKFLRHLRATCLIGEPTISNRLFNSLFADISYVHSAYISHSQYLARLRCEENKRRLDLIESMRRKYKCRFDKKIC